MDAKEQLDSEGRVALARWAFKEYFARCFWSWDEHAEIDEETIPLIVKGLRHYGGHKGYEIAARLCQ